MGDKQADEDMRYGPPEDCSFDFVLAKTASTMARSQYCTTKGFELSLRQGDLP